jgi:hypothetical protein
MVDYGEFSLNGKRYKSEEGLKKQRGGNRAQRGMKKPFNPKLLSLANSNDVFETAEEETDSDSCERGRVKVMSLR